MSERGSTNSIETLSSDGCPVSPSLLYDELQELYYTCQAQPTRRALTSYYRKKTSQSVGKAKCLSLTKQEKSPNYHRSRTFRQREKQSNQEMISICM